MLGANRLGIIASARKKPAVVPVETGGEPAYTNQGGKHNRTSIITVTSNMVFFGTPNQLVDGQASNAVSQPYATSNGNPDWTIVFDFGVGIEKRITEFQWKQDVVSPRPNVLFQGSDDSVSWTTIHGPFSLGTVAAYAPQTVSFTNSGFYRYYRLTSTTDSFSNVPFLGEIEFKLSQKDGEPTATSYNGYCGSGDRRTEIVVTQKTGQSGNIPSNLLNGREDTAYDWGFGQSDCFLLFDFGIPIIVSEFNWTQNVGNTHGTWKWQGSNDGFAFVDLGGPFTLGGVNQFQAVTPVPAGHRYYRLQQVTGPTSFDPWLYEIKFKTAMPAA
jgi:hypothetical protein